MTHTLSIPKPWQARYNIARVLLVLAFTFAAAYFAFLVLFPSQSLVFDFKNPQASKNTLLDPRGADDSILDKGNIPALMPLLVDAPVMRGDYSLFHINILTDSKFTKSKANFTWPTGETTLRKSYRAFFLPIGSPITEINPNQTAIHSGSLLSFADGVFLIDGNLVRPIGDASIFENLGYDWDDVMPASEEDMGAYEKGKIVTLGNIHPDGTVLHEIDTDAYFLIRDGEKHPLLNKSISQSYLQGTHPIEISSASSTVIQGCILTISGLFSKNYACETPIDALAPLPGDTFQISTQLDQEIAFQTMDIEFTDTVNIKNMRVSLSTIKQRILAHYGQ
ncbi:MAG: hypothetical protein PHT88_01545 [Candidatus Moranbacteria bacterium]|nr:hypothetical protein [Candidatus Moranbacteria bacterium]